MSDNLYIDPDDDPDEWPDGLDPRDPLYFGQRGRLDDERARQEEEEDKRAIQSTYTKK